MISRTGALLLPFVENLEELVRKAFSRERFLLLRRSLELSLPFCRFLLLSAPLRRVVPLPSRVICAAAGPNVIAGRVLYNAWAQVVSVAGVAVGAVVLGRRALVNAWVPVNPVVGGAVGAVVAQPRAISHSWELMGLVGGERPTLAVGDVGLRVGPADGGGGSVVHLPITNHQIHVERPALLLYPGSLGRLNPDHVDGNVVSRWWWEKRRAPSDY